MEPCEYFGVQGEDGRLSNRIGDTPREREQENVQRDVEEADDVVRGERNASDGDEGQSEHDEVAVGDPVHEET